MSQIYVDQLLDEGSSRIRMSPAQRETHHAIAVAGGVVTTCRSLDDVAAFLVTLGVPSRTTAP